MFIPASAADFTASDVILDATQPFQCFHNLPLSFNYSMQTLCLKVSYGVSYFLYSYFHDLLPDDHHILATNHQ